jgi:magnesium chelatase family protein
MSLAVVYSRATLGIQAPLVTVEVHIATGLPAFSIVGLPETTVKESKERVRSALINSHFDFPISRITINLGPADLPKEGGQYDLPIAIGILVALRAIPAKNILDYEFAGELSLGGELRSIQGTLLLALAARESGRALIVPLANAREATFPGDNIVYPARHLLEVLDHLTSKKLLQAYPHTNSHTNSHSQPSNFSSFSSGNHLPDLAEVRGQNHAKRALEIAAAGGHNLLMIGPPGTGKTLLASCLPSILPPLTINEALEVAALYSLHPQRQLDFCFKKRNFRNPHHTASSIALVGGGTKPKPGEISLAHYGILFLDELPEFDRHVLEVLREPLESGKILISRATRKVEFPANFQLIAAMNPCPCGYLGDTQGNCRCTSEQINRYHSRLSGPLLDRIDLHVAVPRLASHLLFNQNKTAAESSQAVLERVQAVFELQQKRAGVLNARLTPQQLSRFCSLNTETESFTQKAMEKMKLSARSFHRVLRLGRTIADLASSPDIQLEHIQEAITFRKIDLGLNSS